MNYLWNIYPMLSEEEFLKDYHENDEISDASVAKDTGIPILDVSNILESFGSARIGRNKSWRAYFP